ncbi:pantetheine-phosphate adenylyltransferase [Fibrobacter succinogenes subsp. succinogenes S85]|uniref:Phosphopantetheine adenylyltransferase n=1 Tax=Fibrobacter succinogenes (strain ATCC 19169 / S85) TaxID=59374 RepID=A0ABM5LKE9_FIBSS|nr:pantetheine-phosphate adenylyltransferase [Fibrobacter succinogenes]ACX76132.1 pantetheine-phosphate adenylyltransferase [Fibrobacter succinogenes subsp. succinogenes S85]
MVWNSKAQKKSIVEDGCRRRVAVFAGSFDPFTVGHLDLVKRAAMMFDSLFVVVAQNASKKNLFDAETRAAMVEEAVSEIPNVSVAVHGGLTVDFMKTVGAHYLVRGIRNSSDLDAEQAVAWNNKVIYGNGDVETVLLLSAQEHLVVSSTLVRELLKCGAAKSASEQKSLISKYVPKNMVSMLLKEFRKNYEAI